MSNNGIKLRFVTRDDVELVQESSGPRHWLSKPGLTEAEQLVLVRAYMRPREAHPFHRHPTQEEIIYILSGRAEQWVGSERRILGPGELAHIPPDVVHATYNGGDDTLEFLAILSPAKYDGPAAVDVSTDEPWCFLRVPP